MLYKINNDIVYCKSFNINEEINLFFFNKCLSELSNLSNIPEYSTNPIVYVDSFFIFNKQIMKFTSTRKVCFNELKLLDYSFNKD